VKSLIFLASDLEIGFTFCI